MTMRKETAVSAPRSTTTTPTGTVHSEARGQAVRYSFAETSLGRIVVAATERGVCLVAFGDSDAELLAEATARLGRARIEPADAQTRKWAKAVAALVETPAAADAAELPLDVHGTAFQRQVWAALRDVPAGETVTYSQLAEMIGRPTATRAVAAACGANPTAVVVPCHRVIGADGSMRGYRWGIDRKRALLDRERSA
jgi:AraC family transcriptional regulator, regulatory protein of adaptative response / methylated-DNA-[protein]-cysteine methyltransferase